MVSSRIALRATFSVIFAAGVAVWVGPLDTTADLEVVELGWGADGELDLEDDDCDRVAVPALAGKVLVAADDLGDDYFAGTRIYMLVHDDAGAVGVVVNKPRMRSAAHDGDVDVFEGGPVARDQVVVLVDEHAAPRDSVRVAAGVSVLTEPSDLENDAVRAHARVFVGYAGWAPGQLEGEIARGVWTVRDGSAHDALDPPAQFDEKLRAMLRDAER